MPAPDTSKKTNQAGGGPPPKGGSIKPGLAWERKAHFILKPVSSSFYQQANKQASNKASISIFSKLASKDTIKQQRGQRPKKQAEANQVNMQVGKQTINKTRKQESKKGRQG